MPIFWKYLSKEYLKVFFLSILAFISILLVTRLKEIANFATISSSIFSIIQFVLYQIPHVLPIAISISCLISSILLFQRLSKMSELTAFRTCGISLKQIITPLIFLAIILSLFNFFIVSELTPRSKYKSKELFYQSTSMNPLVLLQRRKKMSTIKNSYIEISTQNNDLSAKDILIIMPNKSNQRLCLMSAKNLELIDDNLDGKNISFISYLDSSQTKNFDNLIIENQSYMTTKASAITGFIKVKEWNMNKSSMPIKMLLIKAKEEKSVKQDKKYVSALSEIAKRIAFALSSFSFTFIGASYGITLHRSTSKKNLIVGIFLTFLILISFTVGKALKYHSTFSMMAYIIPQLIALLLTGYKLKKLSRGYE
ncbi:MAG: LptF/LptG family permease [Parachlamydiales bacterium]|nr:LptF/LptG family permease [Parachlamydiales bacterium]